MKCTVCGGSGIEEFEHGLISRQCTHCKGTGEEEAESIVLPKVLILSARMGNGESLEELADKARKIIDAQEANDNRDRVKPDNQPIRSSDPSKPTQPKKRKAKARASKKAS